MEPFVLDLTAYDGPLHRRLTLALRDGILGGRLAPGTRLPATRALAAQMGLGRNTVTAAFEQLIAEGFLEARTGAGTFVAATRPDGAEPAQPLIPVRPAPRLSRFAQRLPSHARVSVREAVPFRGAMPALDAFPWEVWARLLARRWRRPGRLAAEDHPAGFEPLRAAIAAHLRSARALTCSADQVLVTGGAQQALDVAARLLLDPGAVVAVEDPGFPGADGALASAGARLVPVPLDGDGMMIPAAPARAVMVTPSRNYPLGTAMSLGRRLDLLDWAGRHDAWVIEDDYDSDFRFDGRPVAALQGLDRDGRVLYAGTFTRAMFPALRLGYLVVPPALVEPARAVRACADGAESLVAQAALADFFAEGRFSGHLRAMRGLYAERRAALTEALAEHFGDRLCPFPADGGMHLTALLPPSADDVALAARAAGAGIAVTPLSPFFRAPPRTPGLVLGFAGWPPDVLRRAVRRLAAILGQL